MGILIPGQTIKVSYDTEPRMLRYGTGLPNTSTNVVIDSIDNLWALLQQVLDVYSVQGSQVCLNPSSEDHRSEPSNLEIETCPTKSPFWGGFMGYISYEAGLETIDVPAWPGATESQSNIPDVNFAFVQRSIVFDHAASQIYVQSLVEDDRDWVISTARQIAQLVQHPQEVDSQEEDTALNETLACARIMKPSEAEYRAKVLACQQYLSSGDSYELCLTDETTISFPGPVNAWSLYKRLRRRNPAPFGAFLRLSDAPVVGSSPERFLHWDRAGRCEFRPIKGTVKKSDTMTRKAAHAILNSSKERVENLMIVDLIRHDLSGVVGAQNCAVSKLMVVEEYETVYQLVSVIQGKLRIPDRDQASRPRGLDILRKSLPPGSMTGAPKKRSCKILREIEQRGRGIYSGVIGYLDIGGAGDFSVVIRTAVRHEPGVNGQGERWHIGAGGAITVQSTDEAEYREMEVKATGALIAFLPDKVIQGEP